MDFFATVPLSNAKTASVTGSKPLWPYVIDFYACTRERWCDPGSSPEPEHLSRNTMWPSLCFGHSGVLRTHQNTPLTDKQPPVRAG